MANTSVSGLVSGLDTATIISQLMQIEAQPQTNLKNRVSIEQTVVTALQAINAKLAGINAKAGDLAKLANWSPTTATSSNANVTVRADAGAAMTSLGFTVNSLASSYQARYATTASSTTAGGTMTANASYTVTFADGRTPFTFATGDGSLSAVASALNATGSGVQAAVVPVADPVTGALTYALSVQDSKSGSASGFTITPTGNTGDTTSFLGGAVSAVKGADASITIDGQTAALKSSTNTFTDLMPGVDVTLGAGAAGTSAAITVARDVKGMTDSVKAMVDAVNSVLSDIDTQTGYNATTKKSGPLAGESLLRDVRNQLLSAVTNGVGGKSLADVGIQVDRYGKVVFDESKFQSAYTADPNAVAAKFVDTTTTTSGVTTTVQGLASKFAALTKTASDPTSGTLTLSITGHNSEIKNWQDDISDWDVRLQTKQQSLQRQYAALEVALGKLQDQASWLNGQIGSLPKMG